MEATFQKNILTIVSDKKSIQLDPTTGLSIEDMFVELPGEYEKSGFLLTSRLISSPFDPIAVAHREMNRLHREQEKRELGDTSVESDALDDIVPAEEISLSGEIAPIDTAIDPKNLIHTITLEGYNILIVAAPLPARILKDEHFASFIKKIDAIIASPSDDHQALVSLIDPRLVLFFGEGSVEGFARVGKVVEPVTKWKSREADFQLDEGMNIALVSA